MPERIERILRAACWVLAALLLLRFGFAIRNATSLRNVTVPALPRLVAETSTNALSPPTNAPAPATNASNIASDSKPSTNLTNVAASNTAKSSSAPKTNAAVASSATNRSNTTNNSPSTNLASAPKPPPNAGPPSMPGVPMPMPMGMMMGGAPKDDLSPATKKQVERIVQSGILAPYMPPMPSALMGIADDEAFIRSDNGQTGAIKEGATLGNLKLLRIGVNRVLIEENGEKKELMVFGGTGGVSLLPPSTNSTPSAPAAAATNSQTANLNLKHKTREKL